MGIGVAVATLSAPLDAGTDSISPAVSVSTREALPAGSWTAGVLNNTGETVSTRGALVEIGIDGADTSMASKSAGAPESVWGAQLIRVGTSRLIGEPMYELDVSLQFSADSSSL